MPNPTIINMIILYSKLMQFDPTVAIAVARVESNFNPNAIGAIGEIGLYQLRPEYLTETERKNLHKPSVQIMLGIARLKKEKDGCYHKKDLTYLVCYNYGRTNALKVKHPDKFSYVKKVRNELSNSSKYVNQKVELFSSK